MNTITLSDTEKREIVSRPNGSDTMVQASKITSLEALTFAIGFLAHHFLYKQSKADGVTKAAAQDTVNAIWAAGNRFDDDVVDGLADVVASADKISDLGEGVVNNPYNILSE